VRHFSRDHRVIVIDLAGHGHSGLEREAYTMAAFGKDVRAVIEDAGAERVVLIGHSMGGPVSAAAARLMPESVIGIVGVDTFLDLSMRLSSEDVAGWMAPLRQDFRGGANGFVRGMFVDATDAALRDWVVADMSAAPPEVALSAMEEMLADMVSGRASKAFEGLEIPVVAINADMWPTNVEANRRHMHAFEAVIMEGTDHFLHMAVPGDFNRKLERVIADLLGSGARD
jgi:pimeloyl-ACP methyl ester carboxylesterase